MNLEHQLLALLERAGPNTAFVTVSAAFKVLSSSLTREDALNSYLGSTSEREILSEILTSLEGARTTGERPLILLDRALTTFTRQVYGTRFTGNKIHLEALRDVQVPFS
jgi:hypothetical protein